MKGRGRDKRGSRRTAAHGQTIIWYNPQQNLSGDLDGLTFLMGAKA